MDPESSSRIVRMTVEYEADGFALLPLFERLSMHAGWWIYAVCKTVNDFLKYHDSEPLSCMSIIQRRTGLGEDATSWAKEWPDINPSHTSTLRIEWNSQWVHVHLSKSGNNGLGFNQARVLMLGMWATSVRELEIHLCLHTTSNYNIGWN